MKPRRLYFRKKGKAMALEGKTPSGASTHIYTLGDAESHLNKLLDSADFFTLEKKTEIIEKMKRIAIRSDNTTKHAEGVRLININRSPEKDAIVPAMQAEGNGLTSAPPRDIEEMKRLAWELSK